MLWTTNLKHIKDVLGIGGLNILKRNYAADVNKNITDHQKTLMSKNLPKVKPITGVKNIILIASGKGGVGKSTVAVNVATALKLIHPTKNIGLLDTDVFGPSIPLMMNLNETPLLNKDNLMIPLLNYGIKCMSMGFLIAEDAPLIWRGLMVMQAIEKLMRQVFWDSIDYLIVDTPPGTGDTHLSIIQNIPISGVILVTTPQSTALQVTKRGATMFKKLNVPIIGIVENMSSIECPSCSSKISLFGNETHNLAASIGSSILDHIPLHQEISSSSDKGVPIVMLHSNSKETMIYKNIAEKVTKFIER